MKLGDTYLTNSVSRAKVRFMESCVTFLSCNDLSKKFVFSIFFKKGKEGTPGVPPAG